MFKLDIKKLTDYLNHIGGTTFELYDYNKMKTFYYYSVFDDSVEKYIDDSETIVKISYFYNNKFKSYLFLPDDLPKISVEDKLKYVFPDDIKTSDGSKRRWYSQLSELDTSLHLEIMNYLHRKECVTFYLKD